MAFRREVLRHPFGFCEVAEKSPRMVLQTVDRKKSRRQRLLRFVMDVPEWHRLEELLK